MIHVVDRSGTTMVRPGSSGTPGTVVDAFVRRDVNGAPVGGVEVPELLPPEVAAGISDEELAALALTADTDETLDDDAVSLWELDQHRAHGLLPEWYMPVSAVGTRRLRGWRRNAALVVVGAFLAIDAAGLCSTYGPIITGH